MTRRLHSILMAAGLIGASAFMSQSAAAQQRRTISVGRFTSEQTCRVYEQSAGRSRTIVTPDLAASASSWRTWLVKDCVQNFASIRTSLEAALASTGKFAIGSHGAYTLTGRISAPSGIEGGPPPSVPNPGRGGYAIASTSAFVNIDLELRDPAGRVVFGGLLTKHLETGSNITVGSLHAESSQSGAAVYTELQHEVALAAARMIAFHIIPLQVTATDGHGIQLNYGAPLLTLGTMVQVTSPDGATALRYLVTSSNETSARAEIDGDGDSGRIPPGSVGVVIEPESAAANGRRLRGVELP